MSDLLVYGSPAQASVDAGEFLAALKKASAVLKKSSVPVLEELFVRFCGGHCILTATDMETWIVTEIPAKGDNFAFVFSRTACVENACRYFGGKLTLTMAEMGDEKRKYPVVTLSCGSKSGEYDAYPAEDYPDTPETGGGTAFSANAAALLERINRVSYAARKSRQEETGAAFCIQFMGSRIYALDGYRAAWDEGSETVPQPFLLYMEPLRCLRVFGSSQVELRFSPSRLSVTDGSTTVIYRIAEISPFQLDGAIPKKYAEVFSAPTQEFLSGLRYLQAAAPKTRMPYVYLRGKELSMTVNGRKYSAVIDIDRPGDTEIGLNLHYALDALKQFAKEKYVTVKISGAITPVVIEAEGRNDHAMVLPLRNSRARAAA